MKRIFELFVAHNGILKTSQALALGISPRTLYAMRDSGLIRQISRGVYQLADHEFPANPDLVLVALRIPKAVICLVSALHYFGMTTQIPHQVNIALPQSAEKPRLEYPPIGYHLALQRKLCCGDNRTADGQRSGQNLFPGKNDRGLFQIPQQSGN
jgi:predicted transcriptional regulator of viral defense system